jgi:ABC-type amino acid transport substrate-binding protein
MQRFLLSIGIVFSFLLLSCKPPQGQSQSTNSLARISETKTIRVGYIVFPHCIIKDVQNQNISGHHVATIEEIAKQAGWKVEYTETSWSTFPAGLATGQFDVSIAPTFVTTPRALSVSFTRPLFYAGNSAIVKKGETRFSTIQSIDQPNITVAVTEGEAGHEYAKANFKQAKLIIHSGSDQSLTFQDVLSGRADVALGDAYVSAQFAKQHPEQITDLFAASPYNLTPVSWAVKQGDSELVQFLNASIESLETQGKLLEFEKTAGAHWLHLKKEWEVF